VPEQSRFLWLRELLLGALADPDSEPEDREELLVLVDAPLTAADRGAWLLHLRGLGGSRESTHAHITLRARERDREAALDL